ncbi:serine/threonine-protein kinase [Nocardioides ultimimeridianus]
MLGSLRALLDAEEPRLLPPERALAILGALSDTLFPVHAAGRAHGAFSPETLRIDSGVDGDTVTMTDEAPDAAYLAPEVRDGGEPTPAVDAYAFAALAHLLLAGDAPAFEGDGTPLPVAARHPGFPAFAGEAIARGLQKDPASRPLPKVLFTLLRVVPVDRWPASSQPEPVVEEPLVEQPVVEEPVAAEQVVEEHHVGEPVAAEAAAEEIAPQPSPDPLEHHEWHAAFAPVQDVPSIDWRADEDPTRPSHEVPAIDWAHTDEAAEEAPEVESATDTREQPAIRVDDATFLHDFMDALRAPADVPSIEPLDHAIPEEQLEHRPGRRVRRKHHERSPERTQKVVLVLILLVLIAVGAAWALTHKDGPRYDPKLQGASLVLSHPAPART